MKASALLACLSVLLVGCTAFGPPSANQAKRQEKLARAAEARSVEFEKTDAINDRAAYYERQGKSPTDARALANAEAYRPSH